MTIFSNRSCFPFERSKREVRKPNARSQIIMSNMFAQVRRSIRHRMEPNSRGMAVAKANTAVIREARGDISLNCYIGGDTSRASGKSMETITRRARGTPRTPTFGNSGRHRRSRSCSAGISRSCCCPLGYRCGGSWRRSCCWRCSRQQ
jgi:hypothetical protein